MQKNNYRHTKDVLRHSAVYKKRRKARVVRGYLLSFAFVIILIGIAFLFRLSAFGISEIQVKGLQSASTQAVIDEVNSNIGGNYALIIPKKSVLFYPKDKIRDDLLNKFSTFKDVKIETVDSNKLEVSVIERNAGLVICKDGQTIEDSTFANCFFADSNSMAFQNVTGEPDKSLIRIVDLRADFGSTTLASSTIEEVYSIKSKLEEKSFAVKYVQIVDSKTIEFHLVNNGKIIFPIPATELVLSVFATALGTSPLSSGAQFEYVDTRFGNKVFFKMRDGSNTPSTNNSSSSTKNIKLLVGNSMTSSSTIQSKKTSVDAKGTLLKTLIPSKKTSEGGATSTKSKIKGKLNN